MSEDPNPRFLQLPDGEFVDVEEYKILKDKKTKELVKDDLEALRLECIQLILGRQEDHASELIVEHIKHKERLYTTRDDIKSEIWFYDEGIYVPNGRSKIEELTRAILQQAYTPQRVNKVMSKIEADTQIDIEVFFRDPPLEEIPVQNGILNIFTRELSPFTPEKIFRNKLPMGYHPNSKCPNIKQFFSDVLKDKDDEKVMIELIGFCLLKDYRFEKSAMFLGDGRNGKGKALSVIKHFLGVENCCSVSLSQLTPKSTSVCELYGRLANIAGDLSSTGLKDTGMFKQVTGQDLITAKRKYLRDLFFTNYAKMMFACNELPRVYDPSIGFWSRWILFEFPYRFIRKEEYDALEVKGNNKIMDEGIINKITTQDEINGLLIEALDGLDRLIKNKGFSYSKGTDEVKNMWVRKSDTFMSFCMDMIEEHYDNKITKKELRKTYNKYCKLHKLKGCGDKTIKATLEDQYGAIEAQEYGSSNRYWEGIKFKEKDFDKEADEFFEEIKV